MENVTVSFHPTDEQLTEIKDWLYLEDQKERFAGLYINWNSVEFSVSRNECAVILLRKTAIGFLTWFGEGKVVKIQLAEIKPGLRKNGYGRILMDMVVNKLREGGCMVVHLHCQPQDSKRAWQKIGFQQYPDFPAFDSCNNHEEGLYLYRILVPHAEALPSPQSDEIINLWSVERYQADRFAPNWSWALAFQPGTRKLVKPIIAPASHKWNISWMRKGQLFKSDEVKYFSKNRIDHDGFLIIEDLP